MRKTLFLAASLAASQAGAEPSRDWSAVIAESGLKGAAQAIEVLGEPTAEDLFALGAVRFLRAIEQAMQLRWQVGATEPLAELPLLGMQLPRNPVPEPFRASAVTEIMQGAVAELGGVEAALAAIPKDAEIGLEVRLDDLWLDVDGDGVRGAQEGVLATMLDAFGLAPGAFDENTYEWVPGPLPPELLAVSVRFDAADVPWLRAYGHLVWGVADMVLAFDPTEAIARVTGSRAAMSERFSKGTPDPEDLLSVPQVQDWIDTAAIVIYALRQQPDSARIAGSREHLRQVVALNHDVWRLVGQETDNDREWLPGAAQQAALGFTLPPETGTLWLAALAEMQAVLDGRLLLPYPVVPGDAGINLGRWFDDPSAVDLVGWIQGGDALPYLETGEVISGEAFQRFSALFGGRGLLFALLLN